MASLADWRICMKRARQTTSWSIRSVPRLDGTRCRRVGRKRRKFSRSLDRAMRHRLPGRVDDFVAAVRVGDVKAEPFTANLEVMDLRVVDLAAQAQLRR